MKLKESFSKLRNTGDALLIKGEKLYNFCTSGVWNQESKKWTINLIKIINLSIRSFTNKNLQMRACSLSFRTMLAIVPILAMIFAIGRGFGLQNLLKNEIYKAFPSQQNALKELMPFVDAYLDRSSSEGVFLGIGIVFLLWTLISLLSHVEECFNSIWGIRKGRSFYRKLTDYTSICLFLPILLICASGISIFMSNTVQSMIHVSFISPLATSLLDFAPFVLIWIFLIGANILIPNTKVRWKNTIIPAILCGSALQLVQWLFVTGQIYVSSYSAIYGSFAFLPLLLIWMQLSWLICLIGVVVTYSTQNVVNFDFHENIEGISRKYFDEVAIIELAIIVKRFMVAKPAYTENEISEIYRIPLRLNDEILKKLYDQGFITEISNDRDDVSYQPAFDINKMTVAGVYNALQCDGKSNFIPEIEKQFEDVFKILNDKFGICKNGDGATLIKDLPIEMKETQK